MRKKGGLLHHLRLASRDDDTVSACERFCVKRYYDDEQARLRRAPTQGALGGEADAAKSGDYITQVTAVGPLGLEYLDPGDDPRVAIP